MTARPVRVAIVNDYDLVVAGLAAALAPHADRVAVVELDANKPVLTDVDVVLYDTFGEVRGRGLDTASLCSSSCRLLVFSWDDDAELVRATLAAGAQGYVSKTASAADLVAAIEAAHRGERVLPTHGGPPDPVTVVEPSGSALGTWPGRPEGLSEREAEVLSLICQGLSNHEVADQLFLGVNTVKTHIRSLYRKIGVTSRSKAVLWGMTHGFEPDRSRYRPAVGSEE